MAKNEASVPRDLRALLLEAAERYGTKTAIRDFEDGVFQDVSFARLVDEARALSAVLSKRFSPADRVLVIGKNSYRLALSYVALIFMGAVPVPLGASLSGKQMARIAKACDAAGALYASEMRGKRRFLTGLRCVCFDRYPALLQLGGELLKREPYTPPEIDPDGLAALFFTPGTADAVKGVMLSHTNLLATLWSMDEMMRLEREDSFLSVLPLSHAWELVCGFLWPLSHGATVTFSRGLEHLLRDMRRVRPTAMVVIPYLAKALHDKCWAAIKRNGRETRARRNIAISDPVRPLSARQALKERLLADERAYFGGALRRMLILGGGIDAAVQKGLRQLGVFAVQGYGITECAALAAMNRDDKYLDGAAGLAFPDSVLDIYNMQPDGSGEIRYKGKNVMLGYLNDPERTTKALEGGWLYTGDIGRIDEQGFLHVLGRRQSCIETAAGYLIPPEALERLLCQSPFIAEAAVVGYFDPELRDNQVVALILPERECPLDAMDDDALERAVDDWVAEINGTLPLYQQITYHVFWDTPFPSTLAGELDRRALTLDFASKMNEQ